MASVVACAFLTFSMMRLLRVGDDVHRFNIPFAETK